MDDDIQKALKMIRNGKISASEGEKLLEVLEEHFFWMENREFGKKTDPGDRIGEEIPAEAESVTGEKSSDFPGMVEVAIDVIKKIVIHHQSESDLKISQKESPHKKLLFNEEWTNHLNFWKDSEILYVFHNQENSCPMKTLQVEIYAPSLPDLDVAGKYGDVFAENILGNISISGIGGDVVLKQVSCDQASVITNDSDIVVNGIEADAFFSTINGDLKVVDLEGNADFKSISGDIFLKNVRGKVNLNTRSGDVEGENIFGEIFAKTASGNVKFRQIEGPTTIKTRSGDVEVKDSLNNLKIGTASGNVYCHDATVEDATVRTSSGNVKFEPSVLEEGSSLEIKTRSGSIFLNLPGDSDVSLQAKTVSGEIDDKFFNAENKTGDEKSIEAEMSDSNFIEVPRIKIRTVSGTIRILTQD